MFYIDGSEPGIMKMLLLNQGSECIKMNLIESNHFRCIIAGAFLELEKKSAQFRKCKDERVC